MKFNAFLLLATVIFLGCKSEVKPSDIAKINGYWEIEKVVLADGKIKDYKVSTSVDYFEIKGESGIRKKVAPQLDGTYKDLGSAEKITTSFNEKKAYLNYNSGYAQWKEEIVSVNESELVFKNANNLEYHYKKPIPFSIK